ncbi:MAG: hypothetical protein ACXVQ5_02765 [Actinomycetota bacterium]
MRQPTSTRARRRTRQQRLLRTAIGVVVIILVAALIANFVGGKKKNGPGATPIAQVAFVATMTGDTNASKKPAQAVIDAQGQQIVKMLNDWYQEAFVDPDKFGDGTFSDIAKNFTADAATSFKKDVATLTIGQARTEVKRLDPTVQTAKVTVYFNNNTPMFAVAAVHFAARATLKKSGSYPLVIDQTVTYNFQKTAQGWVVTYYTAKQTQDSVVPSPSASASASPS